MVNSTQSAIEIAGVKDGITILRDGSYRLILRVFPSNFALKSEQEQNSIIFQYQGFLNSLHFPIEIVIRSKKLDLAPYLKKISEITQKQANELIKIEADDYIDFVGKLIDLANIMQKSFYVVIPYNPLNISQAGLLDKLFPKKNTQVFDHIKISDQEFKTNTDKLMERANIVASGLAGLGLHCTQLSSEDIISTFYQIYNPSEASKERLAGVEDLTSPVVASELEADGAANQVEKPTENQNIIDNQDMVEEKQKAEAEQRRLEAEKDAERQMKSPAAVQAVGDIPGVGPTATLEDDKDEESTPNATPTPPQANVQAEGQTAPIQQPATAPQGTQPVSSSPNSSSPSNPSPSSAAPTPPSPSAQNPNNQNTPVG